MEDNPSGMQHQSSLGITELSEYQLISKLELLGHRYRAVSCYGHGLLATAGRGGAGAGGGAELKGLLQGITKVTLRP